MANRPRPLLSDSVTFWGLGGVLCLFLFASSAPSPLYQIYAARWHFPPLTLTIVFALYAISVLGALLITGRLSDHLGRRPVIFAGIILEIAATACFLVASSTVLLGLARVLQGLATGGAIGAMSAALVELSAGSSPGLAPVVNSAAPTLGLAAGGLASSALVQYEPDPMRLIFWLVLAGFVLGAILSVVMRETGRRRPGALASLKPKVGVSVQARSTFVKVLPCLVALWALSGLYLSLGPQLAGSIAGSANRVWGGLIIFLLNGTGATAVVIGKDLAPRRSMLYGCGALFAGVALTFAAIAMNSAPMLITGSVIAGAGFGLSFLGAFRAVSSLAATAERAGTIAAIYVVSYLAFSVPIVIAGIAIARFGLHRVALVFSAAVAILAALGTMAGLPPRKHVDTGGPPSAHPARDLTPCPGTVPPYVSQLPNQTGGEPGRSL
jgi:MFS family permease